MVVRRCLAFTLVMCIGCFCMHNFLSCTMKINVNAYFELSGLDCLFHNNDFCFTLLPLLCINTLRWVHLYIDTLNDVYIAIFMYIHTLVVVIIK